MLIRARYLSIFALPQKTHHYDDIPLFQVGAITLNIVTDVAPDQMIPHAETICTLFLAAINASDATGNVMTPVVYNTLCALANLAPYIQSEAAIKNAYQNLIPYIVKTLQVYAVNDGEKVKSTLSRHSPTILYILSFF